MAKVAYSDVGTGELWVFHLSDANAKEVNDMFSNGDSDEAFQYAEKHATKVQRIKNVTGFWDSF